MNILSYFNKHLEEIPKEVLEYKPEYCSNPCYVSVLGKKCGKLYEAIYGRKVIKGVVYIQLLALETEKNGYVRNMYYNNYGMSAGVHSYGYTKKSHTVYGQTFDYDTSLVPVDRHFCLDRIHRVVLNPETLATLDSELKYCCYKHTYLEPMPYVRLFRKYPKECEMLMKFDLAKMISENNLKKLQKDQPFFRYLERHHEELRWKAFQTVYNSWKKNPTGSVDDYEKSLSYRIECGKQLAIRNRPVYEKAMKHTTQERLVKWEKENKINPSSYMDYLVACDWLKLDFSDTKVLFPRNFKEVHDNYTEQYGEWKREHDRIEAERQRRERRRAMKAWEKKEAKELQTRGARMLETADRFSFLNCLIDGYKVIVARTKEELIDEGSALDHCVGRMDYDKRMANGESVICFVRKDTDVLTPFATAEVKVSNRLNVVQLYGEKDKMMPELDEFREHWMEYANEKFKKAV